MDTLTVQVWKLDFSEFKSPAAKLVALAIARRSRESGSCWARQATLADDCGVSKQTIARCIEELGAAGWVAKVERRRDDGSRSSDKIWLTLPEIVLSATTVDRNEYRRELREADHDGSANHHDGDAAPSGSGEGPSTVTTQKDSLKESKEKGSVPEGGDAPDFALAVDMIWQRASKIGRQRSSKADIDKALRAAVARGHGIDRILQGMGAYFGSEDATKDDGAFQRGAHVVLANDRWESFLDDAQAMAGRGEVMSPEVAKALGDLGTMEAPTPARQRVWMDLFSKGMPWDHARGPEPGRLGCRVSAALQLEFGFQPAALAQMPPTGDDAAFD
jgi:hypothetical protein